MLKTLSFFHSLLEIAFHNPRDLRHVFGVANTVTLYIKTFFTINWLGGGNAQQTPSQILSLRHFSVLWV